MAAGVVALEPWGPDDLPLLERIMGDPAMTEHLGGPEPPDKLRERHERYQRHSATGRMFKILVDGEPAGSVGYWDRSWHGEDIYEAGWSVLPEFQGRGVAAAATALAIESARAERRHRWLHAFPTPDNGPSNAICRKLGFELLGEVEFEFPKGVWSPSNDWRLDLSPPD